MPVAELFNKFYLLNGTSIEISETAKLAHG